MQRLPVELYGRIFVECLPDEPYVEPASNQAPLLLVRVCRRWREIAHQTPQLWHSLDAVVDLASEGLGTVCSEGMYFYRSWLSRSGSRPLSLAVSFKFCEHSRSGDEWLKAVRCYRERFERLRVVYEAGLDMNQLLDGARVLQHLAIQARFEEGDLTLTIAQPMPHLRVLVLDFLHVSPATLLEAGWKNLTHLAVRLPEDVGYEAEDFLCLLDRCPNLENLIFGPIAVLGPNHTVRSHPKLRVLTAIFDGSDAHDDSIATSLILPGLLLLRVVSRLHRDLEDALMADEDEELGPCTLSSPADSSEQGFSPAAGLPERFCRIQVEGGDECFAMFDLGWTNVTHLDIEIKGDAGVLRATLAQCPNLQALSLYGRHCTSYSTSLFGPFTHPILSALSIGVWAEFGDLLFDATLPSLRELKILATCYGQPEDVREFLIRSGCPLETLVVKAKSSRVWTAEQQAELRELIPTLSRLDLVCSM